MPPTPDPAAYLGVSRWIDPAEPAVRALIDARGLRAVDEFTAARRAFELVRDEIAHSWDLRSHRVVRTGAEALRHGEGLCYAKAMLLAALLRALGLPAGLDYQRLTIGETPESGFCAHGLNTLFLPSLGRWIRLDARGNKPGVEARFSLDEERLAFAIRPELGEIDHRLNLPEPHPRVVAALDAHEDLHRLMEALPDLA